MVDKVLGLLKRWQGWIKAIVSVAILAYLATIIDWKSLLESLVGIRYGIMIFVLLFIPVNIAIRAYRFMLIVNERSKKKIGILDSVKLYLMGYGLNLVAPASSGDLLRSYYGYKLYGIREEMFSSSLLDLIFGFLALFIFALYYSIILGYISYAVFSAGIVVVTAAIIIRPRLLPWNWMSKIVGKMGLKLSKEGLLNGTLISTRLKILCLAISLAGWYLTFYQFYLLTEMYSMAISFVQASAIVPLMLLSRLLPIAVNGLGTQEAVTVALFALAGKTATDAVLVSLSMTVVFMLIPGLVGMYWVMKVKY